MIVTEVYLNDYDWNVTIFYNVKDSNLEEVKEYLTSLGYNTELVSSANNLFSQRSHGMIINKRDTKQSAIMMTKLNCRSQAINTLVHEAYHLVTFIKNNLNIDEESQANLIGDFVMNQYYIFSNIDYK